MNGLPYYKAYPRDFIEGTVGMPFEVKAAYRLVLDLIYMRGGDLPDDPRYIAGVLGCSVRAWNKYRAALSSAGKIIISNGIISNSRADKELETLKTLQEKQAENARGPRKNNALGKPRLSHTEPEPEPVKEDTPSGAVKPAVESMEVLIFRFGKAVLGKSAGGVITRLRKACRYDDAEAMKHLEQARQKQSPIEWINAAIKNLETPQKYDYRNQPEYRGMLDPRMTAEELAYAKAHGLS